MMSRDEEVRDVIRKCAREDQPIPAGVSDWLDESEPHAVVELFQELSCRDELRHPRREGWAIRIQRNRKPRPSLTRAFNETYYDKPSDFAPYEVLLEVQSQFRRLLKDLPEITRRRMIHILQVLLVPADQSVRPSLYNQMTQLQALTFRSSCFTNELPNYPVKLDWVSGQILAAREGNQGLTMVLTDAPLGVNEMGSFYFKASRRNASSDSARDAWDFELIPGGLSKDSKNRHTGRLPSDFVATWDNGLAMHEQMERTVLSRSGPSPQSPRDSVIWPELLCLAEGNPVIDASHYAVEGAVISEEIAELVVSSVKLLQTHEFNIESVRNHVKTMNPHKMQPDLWLNDLVDSSTGVEAEALTQLRRVNDCTYEAIVDAIHEHAWPFVCSILLAEIVVSQGLQFFPARFICGDKAEFLRTHELFVQFSDEHRGRLVYNSEGSVELKETLSAVQVLVV